MLKTWIPEEIPEKEELKYRYRNGLRSSSSVGFDMVATLKKRGSMYLITLPIVVPLPDAPQPSKSTSTGSFVLSASSAADTASRQLL